MTLMVSEESAEIDAALSLAVHHAVARVEFAASDEEWVRTADRTPPENVSVLTRSDCPAFADRHLVYWRGTWWPVSGCHYVYYVPDSWCHVDPATVPETDPNEPRPRW